MKELEPSEKQICDAICEFLNYSGCYVWRVNSGAIPAYYKGKKRIIHMGLKGQSDIQGIHKGTGRFIGLEVKKPSTRKNVTVFQQEFLDTIREMGGISGVATSPEEALEIIDSAT